MAWKRKNNELWFLLLQLFPRIHRIYQCWPVWWNHLCHHLVANAPETIRNQHRPVLVADITGLALWHRTHWLEQETIWGFRCKPITQEVRQWNVRGLCKTPTTLNTRWHADFAKVYDSKLVQIEAQFGKVEAMFKDFCGFRIAYPIYWCCREPPN